MAKNIVICCDGTDNQFSGSHTNVVRTYKVSRRDTEQITFYDPGVGTLAEPWVSGRLSRFWSMAKGLIFGAGLIQNIKDAYEFLMENYEEGDRIFFFGFSRGAYTARATAALLHSIGLLRPGTENLLDYAMEYWRKDFGPSSPGGILCSEFKLTLSRDCPVHFIGVWDTVGSVGFINSFKSFPYITHNPDIAHFRHAVSIDERRSTFRQNLMAPVSETQDVINVWFSGVHSDVGGGYPAAEGGLSKITFKWMLEHAQACGLLVDQEKYVENLEHIGEPPDPGALLHVSLHGFWWIGEILPMRRYSFEERRWRWHWPAWNVPRDLKGKAHLQFVRLHESVLQRFDLKPDYRPINLPATVTDLEEIYRIEHDLTISASPPAPPAQPG